MIEEVFKLKLISVKDNFIHFSHKGLQKVLSSSSPIIKLKTVKSNELFYFTCTSQSSGELDDDSVGVSTMYANQLGLLDEENVIISSCQQVPVVKKVYVSAVSHDDYDVIEMSQNELQLSILNQIRVVSVGQRITIWFSRSLHCSMRINSMEPHLKIGRLEQLTDIIISSTIENTTGNISDQNKNITAGEHKVNGEIPSNVNNNIIVNDLCDSNTYLSKVNETLKTRNQSSIFRVIPIKDIVSCCTGLHKSLNHPYNAFVNKDVWSLLANKPKNDKSAIICYISKIERKFNEELYRKRSELGVYIRLYRIPDKCKCMSPKKNGCCNLRNQALYISTTVKNLLILKTGSKVNMEVFTPCLEKKVASVTLSITNNMSVNEIETWFRQELLDNGSILVNNNAPLPVELCTGSIENVVVSFLPNDVRCWPFCSAELKTCQLSINFINSKEYTSSDENETDDEKENSDSDENENISQSKENGIDAISFKKVLSTSKNLEDVIKEGIVSLKQSLKISSKCVVPENMPIKLSSNVLCTGASAYLLSDWLCNWLSRSPNNIYISKIDCKSLKGKKGESVQKILVDRLQKCIYYQPSLLVLVDIDAVAGRPSHPENKVDEIFFLRMSRMIRDILIENQVNQDIGILATARSTNSVNTELLGPGGYHLFPTLLQIPPLSKADRVIIIKEIIRKRLKYNQVNNHLNLDEFASRTDGYNYEDLLLLAEKAFFQAWQRKVNGKSKDLQITTEDLLFALNAYKPSHLHSINLYRCTNQSWDTVGGMKVLKDSLTECIIWPSKYRQVYGQCPLRSESGVLLYGVPGTGKTLLASALAGEAGLNFISVKGPELLSKYIGASEEAVRNVFEKARKAKPCILFFDEFDSLAPSRGHDSSGVMDRVVNQLLTQMDGVEECTGVYIVATTSRPDLLDPALLRPGRIGYTLHCPLPEKDDRLEILQVLSRQLVLDDDCNLSHIAEQTNGFSGADLQAVIYGAQMLAYDELQVVSHISGEVSENIENKPEISNKLVIKNSHLLSALQDAKPSLQLEELKRYLKIYKSFQKSRSKTKDDNSFNEVSQKVTMA